MLTERLQILVSPEQRRRLEGEARRTGSSVGALVREAIDARFGSTGADERRRAVEEIVAMRGTFLPVEELEAIVDEERDLAAESGRARS
jgi:hypothetical protein